MRGDLSRVADGFRCRRCDGTIQEVDLAEDLMVDNNNNNNNNCLKSNIQCIEIRVQWTVHLGAHTCMFTQ